MTKLIKNWKELKRINQIPQIFIRTEDIYKDLKYKMKDNKYIGGK